MSVEYVCDGCGKRAKGYRNRHGDSFSPQSWFQRTDEDGTQDACSRPCVAKIAEKTGKTSVVLPI